MEKEKVETIRITEFKSGESVFTSNGFSKVKVTKNGKVMRFEIPIQSTGISELVDSLHEKAPQPPSTNMLVQPDSPIGQELGLQEKKWMKIPDLTDPDYKKAQEDHNMRVTNAVLLKGLAVDIKDEGGVIVTNEDIKIEILKSMGMSSDQFNQIVTDVQNLTRWTEEEKENFLE